MREREREMGCASSKANEGRKGQKSVRGLEGDAGRRVSTGGMPRIKMVLLGDSGVGKSCLVLRFVRGQFDPSSKVTVGAAFMSHPVALPDSSTVKFEIWVSTEVFLLFTFVTFVFSNQNLLTFVFIFFVYFFSDLNSSRTPLDKRDTPRWLRCTIGALVQQLSCTT